MRALLCSQKRAFLLSIFFLSTQLAWSATPQKKTDHRSQSERLVDEAYVMAGHFSPEERADLLLDLLHSPAGRVEAVAKFREAVESAAKKKP